MKNYFRFLAVFLGMLLISLACSSSFEVVETQQSPPPTQEIVTEPASLLPHTFYYLAEGQVFRMERDGQTVTQLTAEPVNVTDYDVSLVDGSIAYVASNQLLLANADGSNRRVLVDGGSSPDLHGFYNPVFSPDGKTLAYSRDGLNLHDLATGTSELVLVDHPLGGTFPPESYIPDKFSPDGTKLLVKIGHPPDSPWTAAIYTPATHVLMQFGSDINQSLSCCTEYGGAEWSADGSRLYAVATQLDASLPFGELWEVNADAGAVRTLITAGAGEGESRLIYLPYKPYLAPDGQLYFFAAKYPESAGYFRRVPLILVRSQPDDILTNWTVLRGDTFELMNEALWAPDASFVVVAFAPNEDVYEGGRAELVYLDGRPNAVLAGFAQTMKWGP